MALTAVEQYAFELINRARLDPLAEAERYDLDLNANLTPGTITTAAKQVVAPNTLLEQAAEDHSIWMLNENIFSHTGSSDSSPGHRMAAAGYQFTGNWSWRENLAWSGTTGTLVLASAIEAHHEGLYRSEGHRENTFGENSKELGLAQVQGVFTTGGNNFNASMLTLNYASTGTDNFITGVAYHDLDGDAFYSIGEGISDVEFSVGGDISLSASAGGYALGVTPGEVDVSVSVDGSEQASLRIDASEGNAKLDLVTDQDGLQWLDLSASADLIDGISNARLLGVSDLDLSGTSGSDTLVGNKGRNVLRGEGGDDALFGGTGIDILYGGEGDDLLEGGEGRDMYWEDTNLLTGVSGNADVLEGEGGNDTLIGLSGTDVLDGGDGDDILTGGSGRDTFVFNGGHDRITDFALGVDVLTLEADPLSLPNLTSEQLASMISVGADQLVLDFGGDTLTVDGLTDSDGLLGDVTIV